MNIAHLQTAITQALEQAKFDVAAELAEQAIQLYPEQAFGYFYLGETLVSAQSYDFPQLLWAYGQAACLENQNVAYALKYAQVLFHNGELDKAAGTFSYVLKLKPKHREALIGLSAWASAKNQFKDALAYLYQIDNPDAEVHFLLAQAAYFGQDEERAYYHAQMAADAAQPSADALHLYARILIRKGHQLPALSIYNKLIRLVPDKLAYQMDKALLLVSLERYQEAYAQLLPLTELPDGLSDVDFLSNFASIAYKAQAYEKVVQTLGQVLGLGQRLDLSMLAQLASAYLELGRAADVLPLLVELPVKLKDKTPALLLSLLFQAQIELGEEEQAKHSFSLLAKAPDVQDKTLALAQAQLLLAQNQVEQAYQELLTQYHQQPSPELARFVANRLQLSFQAQLARQEQAYLNPEPLPSLLQNLQGKIWLFETGKLIAKAGEDLSAFQETYQEIFATFLPQAFFVLDQRYLLCSLDSSLGLFGAFVYRFERGNDAVVLLELSSVDGLKQLSLKAKLDEKGLILTWNEFTVFRLVAVDKLSLEQRLLIKPNYRRILGVFGLESLLKEGFVLDFLKTLA